MGPLSFNSLHFIAFFTVVFGVSFALRARVPARNLFLLLSSYWFYASWDWRFLGLILISTLVDYYCGLRMGEPTSERSPRRRQLLILSLYTNLGILGFFKYFGFFVDSAVESLAAIGIRAHVDTLRIILPVGISFYTFQTLSYTIDRYRGLLGPERSLLNFALFVAFFPQLVAGPIERARHLLPQFRRPSSITWWHVHSGVHLMAWGLFKKVVLADNAAHVADAVFAAFRDGSPDQASGGSVLLGALAFAIQIYCDFSGYTDVARGAARCMGFDLMLNFQHPYFAVNPRDFWRRWHISLSTWLRDYLYIPLGGNRKGRARTYVHLMVTMLLGGLWHGAAWNFVLWGLYCGALLAVHRMLGPVLGRRAAPRSGLARRSWFLARVLVMFTLTCAGWLLFRVESPAQLGAMSGEILTSLRYNAQILGPNGLNTLMGCAAVLLSIEIVQFRSGDAWLLKLPLAPRCLFYLLLMLGFIVFGRYDGATFIYFQF